MPFRMLLAADGSSIARNAARCLIERFGFTDARYELDVIHVHYALPPHVVSALGRGMVAAYYRDETAQALAGVQRLLDANKVPYRSVAKVGMPATRIIEYAENSKADLIVMGSHGRGSAKGLLLGSVAQGIIAGCSVPVLLVREARLPAVDGHVLVAVDGSAYTKKALTWLIRHHASIIGKRKIVLMHVVAAPHRWPVALDESSMEKFKEATFEQAMAPARRQLELAGLEWQEVMREGEPGSMIAEEARCTGCSLIVMGSHGRGGMTSLLLGSVAQRTLHGSTVPILIVR